ncbi:hypothetical protein BCR34DRAFT_646872 [Clohesyomyces aquaticus]|uniref:Toxin subunit n=1 Tax=Clohesyomyces aquaticus TaxID=1231657 RepID=A0A1Y1Y5I6_9PLEO|nr:hypothetical protein BCR34DRAFT_646872 [Clohesyomyces aquaticus]
MSDFDSLGDKIKKTWLRTLRVGSSGPAVSVVHTCLLYLRDDESDPSSIPLEEVANAVFGIRTREALIIAQTKLAKNLPSGPTGVWDRETAAVLYTHLLKIGVSLPRPPSYFAAGKVKFRDGSPALKQRVEILDRDFGPEIGLATTTTDRNGYFFAHFPRTAVSRSTEREPTLAVLVFEPRGKIAVFNTPLEDLVFNASALTIFDINLEQRASSAPGADEFSQIASSLDVVLPPLQGKKPYHSSQSSQSVERSGATHDLAKRITRLRDDEKANDLKYLQLLPSFPGDATKVSKMVLSYRLSEVARSELQIEAPPEVFYGLLATDAQRTFAAYDEANIGVGNPDLTTSIKPLLFQLALQDASHIKASLLEAERKALVPDRTFERYDVSKVFERLRRPAKDWIIRQPSVEDRLWALIWNFLRSGNAKALLDVMALDDVHGDIVGFILKVVEALRPTNATPQQASLIAAEPPQGNTVPQEPQPRRRSSDVLRSVMSKHLRSTQDVAFVDKETLSKHVRRELGKDATDEDVKASTIALSNHLEKQFPTSSFAAGLRAHLRQPSSSTDLALESLRRKSQGEGKLIGKGKAAVDGARLLKFMDENPDFDLAGRDPVESGPVPRDLRVVQRVFKLAPAFDKTQALLEMEIDSAGAVSRLDQTAFIKAAQKGGAISPAEAVTIFAKAKNVHIAAGLLAGQLHGLSNALLPAGLSPPLPPERLERLGKEFPTLKSLFGSGDMCACKDCKTILSPAAYLVDVFGFLAARNVIDPAHPNTTARALDILLSRRADLGNLNLDCENTNTTLPYIDLVCELLEDMVARDGASPAVYTGSPVQGPIGADLLAILNEDLHLGYTSKSRVLGPDRNGAFTARDVKSIVLLHRSSPTSPDWSITILRQSHLDSASLAAIPAYINPVAYQRLADSEYLPSLPFALNMEEARAYLEQIGTPRKNLIRVFKTGNAASEYRYALEVLTLSIKDGLLITTEAEDEQERFWNTATPDTVGFLSNVQNFVDSARVSYEDLQEMLACISWLNPPEIGLVPSPPVGVLAHMFIKHETSSCSLSEKSISNLDLAALDRIHRFLRLFNALKKDASWTISALDRATGIEKIGDDDLTPISITKISSLAAIAESISSPIQTTIHDVLDLMGELSIEGHTGESGATPVTYESIFLDESKNGEIDPAFQMVNLSKTSVTETMSTHVGYLARCLKLSAEDVSTLIGKLDDTKLSFTNVSTVYAMSSLAKRLDIGVKDLSLIEYLSRIEPLASLSNLSSFIDIVSFLKIFQYTAAELISILKDPTGTSSAYDLGDGTIRAAILSILQKHTETGLKFKTAIDENMSSSENKPAVLALLAQIRAVDRNVLVEFDRLLSWLLTSNQARELMKSTLTKILGDTTALESAYDAAIISSGDESKQRFTEILANRLSSYFASVQHRADLIQILVDLLGLPKDNVTILVDKMASLQVLLEPLTAAIPEDDPNFQAQYKALQKAGRVSWVIQRLALKPTQLEWILNNSAALGWPDISNLPFKGSHAISLAAWIDFATMVKAITKPEFPPVKNLTDVSKPYTLAGLLERVTDSSLQLSDIQGYFSTLARVPTDHIGVLCAHFHFTKDSFKTFNVLSKLREAAKMVRRIGLPPLDVINFATRSDFDPASVLKIRDALKAKYEDSEWLGALRTIYDKLRIQKRDALLAFILAYSKPEISSPVEISERLLIDVEMGSETLTSRIIQAHQSVQLFAQRLLMGLEPSRIVAGDAGWDHWTEMSQYRVWEANRKVFIWPELYIEPQLRDDKSELYKATESKLQESKLTTESVENATAKYLEGLERIANMEVLTSFYDTNRSIQHVFARTRGDPPELYYRTLEFDSLWSPWERIDGVEVTGNRLCAFYRNNRLTIAWPVFVTEPDTKQINTPPSVPTYDSVNSDNAEPVAGEPVSQRIMIQLAVSERSPSTGKWSEKLTSEGGVYWPSAGFKPANEFPDDLKETFAVWYVEIGENPGDVIVLSELDKESNEKNNVKNSWKTFAVFSLTGCKARPEPFVAQASRRFASSPVAYRLPYQMYPVVENSELLSDVFRKDRKLSNNSAATLSILELLDTTSTKDVFGKTRGRFSVAHPMVVTEIDKALFALQLYGLARRKSESIKYTETAIIAVPFGTYLPYFYTDSSLRSYFLRPGYTSVAKGDTNIRTAMETFDIFNRGVNLARNYIDLYVSGKYPTLQLLRQAVETDKEYISIKKELLDVYIDPVKNQLRPRQVDVFNFFHPLICPIRSALYGDGMKGMLSRKTQLKVGAFNFENSYAPNDRVSKPFPRDELDFSVGGSYSMYNWELFFHLPFEIATRYAQDQQFEEARKWYHFIFNPQGDDLADPDGEATAPQKKYWITNPFFKTSLADYTDQLLGQMLEGVAQHPDGTSLEDRLKLWVQNWRAHPFRPHAVARTRPVAFQIAVVLKYIKLHIDWGDNLFRQLTRESITQASQLYMTASKILGPRPKKVAKAVETPVRTYNELESDVDVLGNALLDLEDLIPDLGDLPHHGDELPDVPLHLLYFDIPPNEAIMEHWDTVEDRLFKIRHSQDINGNFVSLALTAPPIDPAALVGALASGASLGNILQGFSSPLPHYRFSVMIDRAMSLTGDVMRLGQSLLGMLQARDAEGLARLRSDLEIQVLNEVRQVKLKAIEEAKEQTLTIETAKNTAASRSSYYKTMQDMNMDPLEMLAQAMQSSSDDTEGTIQTSHKVSAAAHVVPTFSVGIAGFGGSPSASISMGGGNAAGSASSVASIYQSKKANALSSASRLQMMSAVLRRSLEFGFQKALADFDGKHLEAQKVAATTHQTLLEKDLAAHDKNIEATGKTGDYLRDKYTSQELYSWNAQRISAIFFQTYQMAFGLAKKAERCFSHELADYSQSASLINYGHWDDLRSGLTSGEHLMYDIKRLETAYLDGNKREFELTKNLSLAQMDPVALLSLRTTGRCTFSVPEAVFDLDCPGHYLRRLKTVSISFPCVVGPMTSLTAKLTLASNRYRSATSLPATRGSTPLERYRESPAGGDPRFVYNVGTSTTSIVTSTGSADSGMLSLRLNDERYLPFEGAGAVGSWILELPKIQQFDYGSISDAVLHIGYTSRDGGSGLRGAVEDALLQLLAEVEAEEGRKGPRVGYRLSKQMVGEWWALKRDNAARIVFGQGHLPFFATSGQRLATVKKATWYVQGRYSEEQIQDGVVLVVGGVDVALAEGDMGLLVGESSEGVIKLGQEFTLSFAERDTTDAADDIVVVLWFDVATGS